MLHILTKHLTNERAWLRTESLGKADAKYREGARMAKERIPQLEAAIKLITTIDPIPSAQLPNAQKKQPPKPQRIQLDLFKIFKR